jgi:precorrin-6B C5,15-methyltransferase / cobalt-precorrin-6B C5,C15-methyltransferase
MVEVVGIGLEGAAGLRAATRAIVDRATVLAGSDRHLSYFPQHPARRIVFSDLSLALQEVRTCWTRGERIVILASGDPLFFGLGRLLLNEFPTDAIAFHPHLSCVQLAFNRLKMPWQDACTISAHGRSLEELTQALQQGTEKIAVLTDGTNTPSAIARLYLALDLPIGYEFWVCENLGGSQERVQQFSADALYGKTFAPLNVVILRRQEEDRDRPLNLSQLPLLGLPDSLFLSFRDRPGLMTKREVRLAILGELALRSEQIIWDIGAGTGSVSIEIARLLPNSQVYAIEKTAIGHRLIEQNCDRFQVSNVTPIQGTAPAILAQLPAPDRVFIGGSGGNLPAIFEACAQKLAPDGIIVAAFATLEHLNSSLTWLKHNPWQYRLLQINLSRSVPVGSLTRFSPLNPVTILTATPRGEMKSF